MERLPFSASFGLRLVAALCCAGHTSAALAIVADPPPRLCAAFSNADAVIVGHVNAGRVISEWVSWNISVEHVYKGTVPSRFRLYTGLNSAGANLDEGRRNLLFIERRNGRLTAWGSDPNGGRGDLPRMLREVPRLSRVRSDGTASVVGLVATEQAEPKAGWSVTLHQARTGEVRRVATDKTGHFTIRLSPGRWTAKVTQPGWTSRMSLYTYDDPDHFRAKPGGCNDLRLEPVARQAGTR